MIAANLTLIRKSIPSTVTLVAVSKTKSNEDIMEAYEAGQRIFGENKVQELIEKQATLPKDIEWHMIGHLQTNKVKYIAPFVSLIHSVDSNKVLSVINKQAQRNDRVIDVLLQVHIAEEDAKFGLSKTELNEILMSADSYVNVNIRGLMGMATFSENNELIEKEFEFLKFLFENCKTKHDLPRSFDTLSMGMSGDYGIAIEKGSTMVRIGSHIFGIRN